MGSSHAAQPLTWHIAAASDIPAAAASAPGVDSSHVVQWDGQAAADGSIPAVAAHQYGLCVPCHSFLRRGACAQETGCKFCHLPHQDDRARPNAKDRDRHKRAVQEMNNLIDEPDVSLRQLSSYSDEEAIGRKGLPLVCLTCANPV